LTESVLVKGARIVGCACCNWGRPRAASSSPPPAVLALGWPRGARCRA